MPEVGDPTPGEHDSVIIGRSSIISVKEIRHGVRGLETVSRVQQGEGAAEGRHDNWGEVVTR